MKKLNDFLKTIPHKVLCGKPEEVNIKGGYVSDLLSDVMGNAQEGDVWITIMKHLNVIAVASLAELPAIIFSKNTIPDSAVIEKAKEKDIVLINSPLSTFELSGNLFVFLNQ